MSETDYDPLYNKPPIISGGSVLEDEQPIISGGDAKTSSDNNVYPLSEEVDKTSRLETVDKAPPSDSDYIRLMEALKKAKFFCKKYNLIELNNPDARKQFVLDLKERCPKLENKTFTDIVNVMIDVLYKYHMGFNEFIGKKSYSGHDESIMITCVKYLFSIVTKNQLEAASKLYTHEQLNKTQYRFRLWNLLSKGFTEEIMPAAELLKILDINLEISTVKL